MTTCQWFLLCENEAVGTVGHPVLGAVPTCQRCADKLDLDLEYVATQLPEDAEPFDGTEFDGEPDSELPDRAFERVD